MKKFTKGFTLIELLVVIAIIGLLTGIIVSNLTASRAKARDAKRVSDMGQLQLALELFFDRCNVYPRSMSDVIYVASECPPNEDISIETFISKIPMPPPQGDVNWDAGYHYYTNDSQTDYILQTKLEKYSEVLRDSLSGIQDFNGEGGGTACDVADFQYCVGPK